MCPRFPCERWVDGDEENDNARVREGKMKLENKVAVITGGNSGIGFGIAREFKNEGAKGVIVGRNQETLDSAVAQLGDNFIAINATPARVCNACH